MAVTLTDIAFGVAGKTGGLASERRRAFLVHGLVGLGLGYFLLSPFAMVFFHLSHRGLDPKMVLGMHHSLGVMVVDAFSSAIPLWWISFSVLGALLGVGVGGVVSALRIREKKIERHARELAQANVRLEEANRKLEESYRQLLQADKMASLGLMSGTVIHDLNNYLTTVLAVAQCEAEESEPESQAQDEQPWHLVLAQARRMADLTNSVRRFSRQSSGARVKSDLHAVIKDASLILHKAMKHRQVELKENLVAREPHVEANANELLQVFVNLYQNALDAMPEGGRLTVATKDTEEGLEVAVADTGIGIPREDQDRIFEAFFTTKPEDQGTGLGLAICNRIVETHQGRLIVESEQGQGTVFRIVFPRYASSAAA